MEEISTEARSQNISLFDTYISSMAQRRALHASRVRCTSARVGPITAAGPCRSAPSDCRHAADSRGCAVLSTKSDLGNVRCRLHVVYETAQCACTDQTLLNGRSIPSSTCCHTCRVKGHHGSTVHAVYSCSKPEAALSLCCVCAHHHQSATSSSTHLPPPK